MLLNFLRCSYLPNITKFCTTVKALLQESEFQPHFVLIRANTKAVTFKQWGFTKIKKKKKSDSFWGRVGLSHSWHPKRMFLSPDLSRSWDLAGRQQFWAETAVKWRKHWKCLETELLCSCSLAPFLKDKWRYTGKS